MKKTLLIKPVIILLAVSLLSGCIWWPEEDGYRRGNNYDGGRGDHYGEHRDRHDGHRDNHGDDHR